LHKPNNNPIQTKQERKKKSEEENGEWERGSNKEEKMKEVKGR
jgi:hypothetical protein